MRFWDITMMLPGGPAASMTPGLMESTAKFLDRGLSPEEPLFELESIKQALINCLAMPPCAGAVQIDRDYTGFPRGQ
jgi:hypothetical protein